MAGGPSGGGSGAGGSSSSSGPQASVVGAPSHAAGGATFGELEDEIDIGTLDEDTQRFVLESHMENLGLLDFMGAHFVHLGAGYEAYNKVPDLFGGRAGGGGGARGRMGAGAAFVTTIKSFVGMGILSLPFACAKGGFLIGPLGLIGAAALAHHCMGLVLEMGNRLSATSFGALGAKCCGPWAKVVVEQALILTQYGFAIADLIFIVENVRDVVCLETFGTACPTKVATCAGALLCLLPFTWLRSLNVLTVPVLMSNAVLLCGISWGYYCCFVEIGTNGLAPGIVAANWAEFPVFFGCAVFSFEGIGLVLPIQHAMQQPSEFPPILRQAMLILALLFSSFGVVGYAAYGPGVHDIIFASIPQNKLTSFLRLFYCLGVFFTYPVMLFPVYGVTESKIKCLKERGSGLRRVLFRTVLVVMTGVIGMQIPHFGLFLGLIGSVACTLLAFVLPALFHLKRPDRSNATRTGDIKDVAIMAFGVIGGGVSFVITLRDLLKADETPV